VLIPANTPRIRVKDAIIPAVEEYSDSTHCGQYISDRLKRYPELKAIEIAIII
jgi:hypothetical protein